jgi:hypothetical protein
MRPHFTITSTLILGLEVMLAHDASMDFGRSCYNWAMKKCHCGTLGHDHIFPPCLKKSSKMAVTQCGIVVAAWLEGPLEVPDMLASW